MIFFIFDRMSDNSAGGDSNAGNDGGTSGNTQGNGEAQRPNTVLVRTQSPCRNGSWLTDVPLSIICPRILFLHIFLKQKLHIPRQAGS